MVNKKFLVTLGILAAVVAITAAYRRPYAWWPVNDMNEQPILKPFEVNGLRDPVAGTQAIDAWEPVPAKLEVAQKLHPDFKNPTTSSVESVAKGQDLYNIYCLSCHGEGMKPGADYQTPVMKKGMPGANLARISMLSDEEIFSTITHGSAIMKRMDFHLSPEERWQVVNYIRGEILKYQAEQP